MNDWFDEHDRPYRADPDQDRRGEEDPLDRADEPHAPGSDWDKAERCADRAHRYYEAGQWKQALDQLNLALGIRPDEAEWQFGLGLTLDAMGRFDEAAAAFARVIELRGEEPISLLHLATQLIHAHQPRLALEKLNRALTLDPDFEPAYCQRILAHALLGEHEQAELDFYLAQQINDRCPTCLDHMARSLAMRRDDARAIWCWHDAQRLDPDDPQLGLQLARAYARAGNPERALTHYRAAWRQAPGDVELMIEMADALRDLGRDDEAGEKLRHAIELEPEQPAVRHRLGELDLDQGRIDAARAHLETARALEPAMPGVHLSLAMAAEMQGRDDEARAYALRELDRVGQTPRQVVTLAGLLLRLGGTEHVLDLLDPMLSGEDPVLMDEPNAYIAALLARALAWMRLDELAKAIADLRRARRIDQDNATATAWLIAAYRQSGDRRRAAAVCRDAVRRFPADRRIRREAMLVRCLGWLPKRR